MTNIEVVTLVKEVVVAIAAIATVVIAAKGLETWRRELTGKAQFEAAKGLARATYRLRDELGICRSPIIRGQEFPEGDEQTAEGWAAVFRNRWKPLQLAVEDFDAALLEAEALWGEGARTTGDGLRKCTHTLYVATESFLEDKGVKGANFEADPKFGQFTRAEVFASLSSKDNPLSHAISEAVADIEKLLLPHLSRG